MVLIATAVRLHMSSSSHQYLPVSLNLFRSICSLIWMIVVDVFSHSQYPWAEPKASSKLETALTTPRLEDISRIRARNALKIMLDVQGDISS